MGNISASMNVDELLASLPDHPARSKLEAHGKVIFGLRRKNWTYQMIADYLAAEFGVVVARNTIHDFVRLRQSRPRVPTGSKQNRAEKPNANQKLPSGVAKFTFDPTKPLTLSNGDQNDE